MGRDISKRDWFAGMALQGFGPISYLPMDGEYEKIAKSAYKLADAMIKHSEEE